MATASFSNPKMNKPCDVCVLVDGNETLQDVSFCSFCQKWLCERCRKSFYRRSLAAFIFKMRGY